MSGPVFRTAIEPETETVAPAASEPGTNSVKVSVPDLFVSYEVDQGRPYTAEYFDVKDVWDKEPSLKRDISEIDGYLKEQVADKKLDNSTKAANQFIKELERKAGLNRYESTPNRISKLLAYIDFQRVVHG